MLLKNILFRMQKIIVLFYSMKVTTGYQVNVCVDFLLLFLLHQVTINVSGSANKIKFLPLFFLNSGKFFYLFIIYFIFISNLILSFCALSVSLDFKTMKDTLAGFGAAMSPN